MIVKTLIAAVTVALPKLIEEGIDYFKDEPKEPVKEGRKTMDRTKFSKGEIAFIKKNYKCWLKNKQSTSGLPCATQSALVTFLNKELYVSKSISTYRRIWKS